MNVSSEDQRILVADGLRGFVIIIITLFHSINHFNLYVFPDSVPAIFEHTDPIINNILTAISSGKAYGIFALLFGFTFYLQLTKQEKSGKDFRLRFVWRMVILFIIGTLNSAFFAGEILVMYSLIGLILVPLRKAKNGKLLVISILLLLQPLLLAKISYILFNQNYIQHFERYSPDKLFSELEKPSFLNMLVTNLTLGKQHYWLSLISNGERIFQTAGLFIIGFVMGRQHLLLSSAKNRLFWKRTLGVSFLVVLFLRLIRLFWVKQIEHTGLQNMVDNLFSQWSDFFAVAFITGSFCILYSLKKANWIKWMEPLGRMSLTNYILQTVMGTFVFYGYGLALSRHCSITMSFCMGLLLLFIQYSFCVYWLKRHQKGPMEQIWHNLTWKTFKRIQLD